MATLRSALAKRARVSMPEKNMRRTTPKDDIMARSFPSSGKASKTQL